MSKFLILGLIAFTTLSLTACNTMNGLGKDISAGGQELSKAAN
jgi:predicted small secreted protein